MLKPLDFSVFPSLLLLVTLFRLSLNIATTRQILQNGHQGPDASGKIIQTFGDFVVHVFDEETRSFYGLEKLWADAPDVTHEFTQ